MFIVFRPIRSTYIFNYVYATAFQMFEKTIKTCILMLADMTTVINYHIKSPIFLCNTIKELNISLVTNLY